MQHRKFLQYIKNTGGCVTVADFDEDWDPIGPMVRREIMPAFAAVDSNGFLVLTEQGLAAISQND